MSNAVDGVVRSASLMYIYGLKLQKSFSVVAMFKALLHDAMAIFSLRLFSYNG